MHISQSSKHNNYQYTRLIKEYVEKELVKKNNDIDAVFLVGSVARGNARSASDIDLLVISRKHLSNDPQDNMVNEEYKGKNFSLIYANLELLSLGIKSEIPSIISFIKDSKIVYDPQCVYEKLKLLIKDFKFSFDLDNEIKEINGSINLIADRSKEERSFIYLMKSIDLAREFLCSQNDPYMAVKMIISRLKIYDTNYSNVFMEMWRADNVVAISDIFNEQIRFIDKNFIFWRCGNGNISLSARINNAKESLESAKSYIKHEPVVANQIILTESYYLFRGVMEYLGYDFDDLDYKNFFSILKKESANLFLRFNAIWGLFDCVEKEEILKKQLNLIKKK